MRTIESPFSDNVLQVKMRKETMPFRKEEYEVIYHYYEDCGQQFTTDELDEINLRQVHNQYREKYNLPFPEEIKEVREKYGLSASKMAEVLGFGVHIYRQYEAGEVPSLSNARLIQLADDPEEFRKLVLLGGALEGREKERVLKTVERLIEMKNKQTHDELIARYVLGVEDKPTRYNGYKRAVIGKTFRVIQYLIVQLNPTKTALNKLLFYVDFMHFRKYSVSFLGLEYRAIEYGTVPSRYESLLEYGAEAGYIVRYRELMDNGRYKETYSMGDRSVDAGFTSEEADTLKQVTDRFKNCNVADLVAVNHKEEAWIDNTQEKRKVDYAYAYKLKAV
ncbi:type II toxin-antitoxin system antitoxin SocA domain-containing protein [Leadbetterella sp. DM7]|uniref:type II toxin-antitoxin system antitoxin SocA domain-containing protein n=1 Tax=Leadbetterella sp. DM7 TaxID=3235085 RepID=UPI00349EAC2A